MPKKRLQCFIAIRFGEKDTDIIYDKIATIVHDEFGFKPRRIDRIEHIENINQKIIAEMNEADIAVADLTYARPSVYYEAGYTHRKIPVIYTCRKDHLRNKVDHQRVHFDVDRFNIIYWNGPNDETFEPNFESRLQSVITNMFNIPLIDDLRRLITDLIKSPLNPENALKRIQYLFFQLEKSPRVPRDHVYHEININRRKYLYENIIKMIEIDFAKETGLSQQDQWKNLFNILEN